MGRPIKKQRGIFERPKGSGVWWVLYYDQNGKRHREKAGMRQSAISVYQKRKAEIREGVFFPKKVKREITFREIALEALEYSKANKCRDAYSIDQWHYEKVVGWFGDRLAKEITPQEIDARLTELTEQDYKPATLNRYRAFLSLIYSNANRNGRVEVNPARLVRLRQENNAVVRFLTDDEEMKLRAAMRRMLPEMEPEFDLALNTGMRRGEQWRLRWEDVNKAQGVITIPRSKNGERRYVRINRDCRVALDRLWLTRDESVYVLPGPTDERNKDPRRTFEPIVKEAGIPHFRYHDIRHTFASRLVMAGVDLRTVQQLMGHKTIAMTVRYAHLAPSHEQEAIERLCRGPLMSGGSLVLTATSTATGVFEGGLLEGTLEAQVQ
jgi:integrase